MVSSIFPGKIGKGKDVKNLNWDAFLRGEAGLNDFQFTGTIQPERQI